MQFIWLISIVNTFALFINNNDIIILLILGNDHSLYAYIYNDYNTLKQCNSSDTNTSWVSFASGRLYLCFLN